MTFIITGCSSTKTVTPQSVFTSDFKATYNSLSIRGILGIDENGTCTVKITSPEELEGVKAVYENDVFKINYNGFTFEADEEKLGENAFLPIVVQSIVKAVKNEGTEYKQNGDGYETSFDTEYGKVNITLDSEMKFSTVKLNEKGFNLEFY